MSRPIRIQYSGAFYHVMARGNERRRIFKNKNDYQDFLVVLAEVIDKYNWICYCYCLMPNHYHLLIETLEPNLSQGMRQLNGKYTLRFNAKYKRVGHLFQGRYKSILVEKDNYQIQLIKYITQNPIRSKLVKSLDEWQWSSHLELIKRKKLTKCIETNAVLSLFGKNKIKAHEQYYKYVNTITNNNILNDLKGGIVLGSADFLKKIKKHFKSEEDNLEIIKQERLISRVPLEKLFLSYKSKEERNKLIFKAHKEYGYSLVEIGRFLNLHYATISRVIKAIYDKRKK